MAAFGLSRRPADLALNCTGANPHPRAPCAALAGLREEFQRHRPDLCFVRATQQRPRLYLSLSLYLCRIPVGHCGGRGAHTYHQWPSILPRTSQSACP